MGSVKFVTGQGGQEVRRIEYDVFGGIYKGASPYGLETGYTGKPYDAVTGLSDYGFRDYSPTHARFITEDPIRDGENWFSYVGNNPVNWVDPWGLSASEKKQQAQENQSKWINNGDGTYTAQNGATLWGLYGNDWKSKSGYTGNPENLQIGETAGQKHEYPMPLDPISYNNNSEKKSFFSNHEAFTSYKSKDGADVLYAGAGANFDYKNGNFNLNAKTGVASYEGSWKASDSKKFNFGFTGRAIGIGGEALVGLEGSLVGVSADAHVFKGGGSIDITLWETTVSIGGDIMAGGIGGSLLLGRKGFKAALDVGVGVGLQVTWRKEK